MHASRSTLFVPCRFDLTCSIVVGVLADVEHGQGDLEADTYNDLHPHPALSWCDAMLSEERIGLQDRIKLLPMDGEAAPRT